MQQNKPVLSVISSKIHEMTKMQEKIAKFVIKSPQQVVKLTISELASATGNKSESAIVRFYKVLGFSGYHEFKVSLATEIAGKPFYNTDSELSDNDSVHNVKEKIYNSLTKTLHQNYDLITDELLEKAVSLLLSSKRIIFLGYGLSGNICRSASFKFMRLGLNCIHYLDSHYSSIQLAVPQEGDLLFCISYSGMSKDIVIPAKGSLPNVKIIALTGSEQSPIGQIADVCFTTHTDEVNYHADVMLAGQVQSMIVDILVFAITIKKGEESIDRLTKSRQALSYLKY